MTVINRAKFHHFAAKDTKVIDGGADTAPPQAESVLKRPGEIGLILTFWRPQKIDLTLNQVRSC